VLSNSAAPLPSWTAVSVIFQFHFFAFFHTTYRRKLSRFAAFFPNYFLRLFVEPIVSCSRCLWSPHVVARRCAPTQRASFFPRTLTRHSTNIRASFRSPCLSRVTFSAFPLFQSGPQPRRFRPPSFFWLLRPPPVVFDHTSLPIPQGK